LSREAAEAAFCAEEQGEAKFWEYHDLLFAHEGELSEANFGEWARQIGLDEAKFTQCYDSKKFAAKVERDVSDGKMAGVYGTPTFFIGNSVIVGPKTLEEFENALRNKDAVTPGQFGSCST
jgi:protein-disulfide isomerase